MMLAPRSIASEASAQMRSTAWAMPRGPSSIGQVMSMVSARKTSWETWRSFSSSELRRIGWPITSWWACWGVSSSRLSSEPMPVESYITTCSRIGSMAGLVTCAKSCLK